MGRINTLYNKYFQKSRTFLFPALGVPKVSYMKWIQSYVAWKDQVTAEDCTLVVLYSGAQTEDFHKFEKSYLIDNPYYKRHYRTDKGYTIYLYDFKDFYDDWQCFLKGQYSKMTYKLKSKILRFYGEDTPEGDYLDSFLNPRRYFRLYAELLGVEEEMLVSVGELCDPYNPAKEIIHIRLKDLVDAP